MKRLNFIYIFVLSLFFNLLFADNVTVHNMSYDPIFVATYYKKGINANIVGSAKKIPPQQKIEIERPSRKRSYDRELIFSLNEQDLKETLKGISFIKSSILNIGVIKGKIFYIAIKGEILKGYNYTEWKVIKPTLKLFSKPFEQILNQVRNIIYANPHNKEIAKVRISLDICQKEKDYIKKRQPIVKKAIEKFTGTSFDDNQTPIIALCCSGGGYRAMIATAGFARGLEKTSIIDSVSYMSGLSGSTWFMVPWLYSGETVANHNKKLKKIVEKDLKKTFIDPRIIAKQLVKKYIFNQPVSSVDIYGSILANKFFGDLTKSKRLNTNISDLIKNIENGQNIFPIFTAVLPGPPYYWFEFTPYEFGKTMDETFNPIWSLGRKFINGKSKDFAPEQSSGYVMGICSSAYAVPLKRIINELGREMPTKIKKFAKKYIKNWGKEDERISPAKLYNPTYGMNAEFGKMKTLTLIDAGLHFNLPFTPLLKPERKIDIIIVCDASSNANGPELRKAERWAREKGLKFPKIDYNVIKKNIINVFKDETDKDVPTIIYMSLVKNIKFNEQFDPVREAQRGFCNTSNFKYTPKQFELLSGLLEYNIIESKEIIKKEIISKIESKKIIAIELNE